jgi:hypothetical protein
MRMWDAARFLRNLPIFVPELEIRWSLGRKRMLGIPKFCQSVPRLASPMPLSSSEMVRVDVLSVAYEEGSAPGAPVREKMAEAPPPVGVAGANETPRVDAVM